MVRWQLVAEELVRERQGALVAYAYLLTRNRVAAEDLVQDALVRTFTRRAKFDHMYQAEGYVRKAIASAFLDGQRAWSRRARREHLVAQTETVSSHAEMVEADTDLAAAMAALPPRERACVALRYLGDFSVAETAEALGLSVGSVKRYTHDGTRALATVLRVETDSSDMTKITVTTEAR
jgi:RNA polymerase sigma-70 factor (ECF subfamily)